MLDDTQPQTPPPTNPDHEKLVDPQALVDEALAPTTPPISTPEPTQTPPPNITLDPVETVDSGEVTNTPPTIPTVGIKEELPLAFIPKMSEPTAMNPTTPQPTTLTPVEPSVGSPVALPPTQAPENNEKKKGKGSKMLLTVLGFFLLIGSLVGGYYIYQQQFGEKAQIAEVTTICNDNTTTAYGCRGEAVGHTFCVDGAISKMYCFLSDQDGNCGRDFIEGDTSCGGSDTGGGDANVGICSSSSPTATYCYGKPYEYVIQDTWEPANTTTCGPSFVFQEGASYSLVCQNTTSNNCAANCVKKTDVDTGIGGGITCVPDRTCDNDSTRTWTGNCALYYCPNGVTTMGKCGDGDPGVILTHGSCSSLLAEAAAKPTQCWQIDLVSSPDNIYCQILDCSTDKVKYSGCTLVTDSSPNPSPSISPSPSASIAPVLSCTGLSKDITDDQIEIGSELTFTCAASIVPTSSTLITYSYRIQKDAGEWENLITETNKTATYTVDSSGSYNVQCRACAQIWGVEVCNPVWSGATQ